MANFLFLCKTIADPIKMEKTKHSATKLTIYVIDIDSNTIEFRLPLDKIINLWENCILPNALKKVVLKESQFLIYLLNFVCSILVPGCAFFLCCFINLTCNIRKQNVYISLNKESLADLHICSYSLESFIGQSLFIG